VAVAHDAADLRQVLVPLHQCIVVRRLLLLARQQRALLLAGVRLQDIKDVEDISAACIIRTSGSLASRRWLLQLANLKGLSSLGATFA
jgi:hypothetical protein